MTRAEEILIRLGIDNKGVTKGLGLVQGQINEFSRTARNAITSALGAYLTEEGIRSIIEYGREIDDTAKRLGVSAEAVQVWGYALRKTGQDQSAMISLFEKMAMARDKALGGETGALNAFKQFGISVDDLRNKRLEDLADQISDVFKAGDPQKLVGALREIGGRSAGGAVDALKDGIKDARKEAKDLGLIMTDDVVAQLKEAGDRMTEIGTKLKVFFADPIVFAMKLVQSIVAEIETDLQRIGLHIARFTTVLKNGLFNDAANARAQEFFDQEEGRINRNEIKGLRRIWSKSPSRASAFSGGGNEKQESEEIRRENEEADRKELEARGKLKTLNEQLADLRRQDFLDFQAMAATELDSLERAKARNKLAQDHLDIANKEKEIKLATEEIAKSQEQLDFKRKEREEADTIFPTLLQIAQSWFMQKTWGRGIQWRQGPFAALAQELEKLQADEPNAIALGNSDRADWDRKRIKDINVQLQNAGLRPKIDHLASMDEEIKKLREAIDKGTGKIQVPMNK
jgi:hypothetical protein